MAESNWSEGSTEQIKRTLRDFYRMAPLPDEPLRRAFQNTINAMQNELIYRGEGFYVPHHKHS